MNWGTRIALLYGTFVVFMLALVVLAFRQDFDLVADDYYEQEIAYQGRIDQMTNASSDGQSVKVTGNAEEVELSFSQPAKDVVVHFFRPSDDTKDIRIEEPRVDSVLRVATDRLMRGRYLVKVEWKANGKTYYQEQDFFAD